MLNTIAVPLTRTLLRRSFQLLVILLIQLGMLLGWGIGGFTDPAIALTQEQRLWTEAWRVINRAYVDDSFNGQNWWSVRQKGLKRSLSSRGQTYDAIEEMMASLGDPFTRFLRPDQYKSLQVTTAGELTGVGLQIILDPATHEVVIVTPIPGSPAEAAGLQSGDRIRTIDGVSTRNLTLEEAAARLQGMKGTVVVVEVLHRNTTETEILKLERDLITLNPVVAQLKQEPNLPPVGYLRLTQFNGKSKQELGASMKDLKHQGAEAFVLDLRNNPGGLLQAGIEVARLWLNEGTIVYTVNRQGSLGFFQASGEALTEDPLVVLVNQGTASAAEILAGALQENDRAVLVGEKTYGKGLIQSLFRLSDGSGMAVTVAKYETPLHHDINKQGIQPTIVVAGQPLQFNAVATEQDEQYETALAVLRDDLGLGQVD